MERQRLEMHKKLNEMFKTYFDAKTTTADDEALGSAEYIMFSRKLCEISNKTLAQDKELNELREAAIKSTKDDKPVSFDSFHQFKKYKQKMRDQGRDNGSLIVSIPNLNGKKLKITKHKKPVVDSNTILDQELDLLPKDKPTLQARVINREFAGFFWKKSRILSNPKISKTS